METLLPRRKFLQHIGVSGAAMLLPTVLQANGAPDVPHKRVGIIGLDTSHSLAFTTTLNAAGAPEKYLGYKVVAAYPYGSRAIKSSADRIPGYTKQVAQMGVKIVDSIQELLALVDVVMLETNDGRLHLEQALLVIQSSKPLFIDKPVAASYKHVVAIYNAAEKAGVPIFSSSSLRFTAGFAEARSGAIGMITGAEAFSPATIEPSHPDFFWYGIHGIEMLFTAMGTGCRSVKRVKTPGTDVLIGTWEDGRIGSFRGTRTGAQEFGGRIFGEKGTIVLGGFSGYERLLEEIVLFFHTKKPPVRAEETLEIYRFMADAGSKGNMLR